ncbi:MAG TPA: proton-conducting transporter membrane subunit [Terracidiphilus sp.]|nr:proton-conducting transporter membrane subunit [Terracidiphilus sp.]
MGAATLILIAPCTLLLGAALQILVARLCSARMKGILAFLTCMPAIFAVVGMAPAVRSGQSIDLHPLPWDGPLALVLHVDALSVLFAFMGACIGGLVLLYSIGYMAHDKSATRFYALMLIFIGGFISLVSSANLFILYLCWELVGLCSFGLVGFWYTNREAVNGARKVLLMTHIAGYGLLAGIIVLYHRAGTALWTDPAVARNFTGGLFALMLVALVAKSVQVPLHTWIPEAMAAPTPVSALLHSACYVTSGVYLAARMHSFGAWPAAWGQSLMWIGTVTMAVGVMYAMVQTDLKRMLAFSTVSQIGYMMMGIGIGTPLAITAGLLHCLNHGFFKGGLFLTAGSVQHAAGTRDMNKLGGLAGKMPQTTLSWLIGVGSMMGIPLMSGFASKWMLYAAALQAGWAVPAMVAWAASLGTVFLGVKATSAVFLGPTTENTKDAHESPPTMIWGMGFLAVGSVVLGVAPQLAVNYFLNPILMALGMGTGVHVTWLGLSADAGSFSSTGGLVLALVSLVVGGAIYLVAYAVRPASSGAAMAGAGGGVFTGGEPLGEQGRLTAGDFSEIFQEHWRSFFRWTNVDRVYRGVWSGLQAVSRALGVVVSWMERNATLLLVVFAAAIFASVRWIVPGVVPTHIPAVMPLEQMPLMLICAIGVAALALFVATLVSPASRRFIPQLIAPLLFLIGGLTVIGLLMPLARVRLGALELAALLTVVLVWQTARSRTAKFAYLAAVLLSAGSMIASDLLADRGALEAARAFLLTGVAVKLAAVPLFFWLLALADEVPALVLGIIIAVVDMAAFGEFMLGVQTIPALLTPQPLFFYAATLTSLLAALLMLTQRSLKRLLVLSTVEDVGFLLLGAASVSTLGQNGVIIAASSHALAKALLFICLAAPEADGALAFEPVALAVRYPVSAFGFLFGMLAMLGIPPTLGFIGRWRLYSAAYEVGFCPLTIFIVSSILALIAYTLALTRNWWGPPPDPPPQAVAREPFLIKAVIVVLVAILLVAGIWPNGLQILMGVRP